MAGDSKFLFINRLDATLRGNAGVPYDGSFASSKNAYFNTAKTAVVYLDGDKKLDDVKFNSKKALKVQGDIIPGETIDFKISLDELKNRLPHLPQLPHLHKQVRFHNS
ncbi:MAG: hypothetical protein BHW64_02860 [Candidatus Melainabacteria bacterium LEY3_CP_29_8]|nr:MAG: hypothetical protein BHW64_02860 [Candidatus Melainabacteria bacterium LEY3_CP_29_8]